MIERYPSIPPIGGSNVHRPIRRIITKFKLFGVNAFLDESGNLQFGIQGEILKSYKDAKGQNSEGIAP